MRLQCGRPFISTCAGLACGWLVGGAVTLLASSVGAGFPSQTADTQSCPAMSLDAPASSATVGSAFYAAGWAIDLGADSGTGVDAVHVWAYPDPGSDQPPVFLGVASYGGERAEVGAAFGASFTYSDFFLPVASLSPGSYRIEAFAHSTVTGTFNKVRTAEITVTGPLTAPAMSLDAPTSSATVGSAFHASGWAIDLGADSGTGVDAVHVWAYPDPGSVQPPVFLGVASYGGERTDVSAVFGASFTYSGFFLPISSLSPGSYRIEAFAHSTVSGSFNSVRTADVTVSGPLMAIDAPDSGAVRSGPFVVSGWALDLSAASGLGVDAIHVWAFPVGGGPPIFAGSGVYGAPRPDVGAIFGNQFTNAGYNTWVGLPDGTPSGAYDLVVYAHSSITNTFNQSRVVRITVYDRVSRE